MTHRRRAKNADFHIVDVTQGLPCFDKRYHAALRITHHLTSSNRTSIGSRAGTPPRGYEEQGTTTTLFDMVLMNNLDRYHLATDVIDRIPGLAAKVATTRRPWSTFATRPRHGRALTAMITQKSPNGSGHTVEDCEQLAVSRSYGSDFRLQMGRRRATPGPLAWAGCCLLTGDLGLTMR